MKLIRKIFKILLYILICLLALLFIIFIWHNICNYKEKKNLKIDGDKIEIYEGEYIHSVKKGDGKYTIILLPGMGTASPYYDYYSLSERLSNKYTTLIIEPLGYGYSTNTSKPRTLDNYEYELNKVLDFYDIKDNIILLGHSYSGISNLNYSNKHNEVKGIVCLDCTLSYQIETHIKEGKFIEEVPKTSKIYSLASPLGLSRFVYSTFMKKVQNELFEDVPLEYQNNYKHLLYNKTLNKTIINEIDDIYYNQLNLFNNSYRNDLNVVTILSDETIEEMKKYKKEGSFYHDWLEMHNLMISNPEIQKIYILEGNHYIHHGNVDEVSNMIDLMINDIK